MAEPIAIAEYGGAQIFVTGGGTFYTVKDGKKIEGTSLAGLKKKIEGAQKLPTPPVSARSGRLNS